VGSRWVPDTIGCNITLNLTLTWTLTFGDQQRYLCGVGLEYLDRSPASSKRHQKGNSVLGGITGPPCSWDYKYGVLALQVRGISDETVKYGYGFWATQTIEWLHCKLLTSYIWVCENVYHTNKDYSLSAFRIWTKYMVVPAAAVPKLWEW
jgi:hypothetical protein